MHQRLLSSVRRPLHVEVHSIFRDSKFSTTALSMSRFHARSNFVLKENNLFEVSSTPPPRLLYHPLPSDPNTGACPVIELRLCGPPAVRGLVANLANNTIDALPESLFSPQSRSQSDDDWLDKQRGSNKQEHGPNDCDDARPKQRSQSSENKKEHHTRTPYKNKLPHFILTNLSKTKHERPKASRKTCGPDMKP